MAKDRKYLLSTRPLPKSIIEEGLSKDVIIEELSFIAIEPIRDEDVLQKVKGFAKEEHIVVFTSMNAVEAVAAQVDDVPLWKIYSIGNTTNLLIEEKWGKGKVVATAENGSALAERLIDDDVRDMVFFCGNKRRDELPNKMRSEKRNVEEVIVYNTIETPSKLEKEYDGVVFYSPSAVHAFYTQNRPGKNTLLFAIGKTTEEAIHQYDSRKVIVGHEANKTDLVKRAIEYLSSIEK